MSVNKVILIGRLGQDPESRATPSGKQVATVSLATSRVYKNKEGERQEDTEWHRLTFYDKTAEIAAQYLKKGSQIYVEGRLHYGEYTDKEGIKRYTTEIIVDNMTMLGSRNSESTEQPARTPAPRQTPPTPPAKAAPAASEDEDVPF